ncbi:MAG: tRNA (adenosine(37)-N6)-dimethylallyltransferase MiaA [Ruminococcus sp.]|nr:tRNA (adenosine(37)-N6)-dimethylallyltransferase MiaA [Ruminococcus sp.]
MKKRPLVILTGPTAVGKTKLSISLAKAIGGEIISADSMQVYKQMNIGSAKIRPEEMEGVPHFLVDALEPDEEFHVVRFQEMARQAMDEIYRRGKIPILVGGTGFYIQAILYDIDFTQHGEDPAYRRDLETLAKEKGAGYLHEMLRRVDPRSAEEIHARNVKRVIRALEYFQQTGKPISAHNAEQRQKESPYCFAYFVLLEERQRLYERINQRVDQMMEEGLLQEVCRLKEQGYTRDMVSMQGLGYKELLDYLEGGSTLEEAVSVIKRDTRHFAKRQVTWFKRERDVLWIEKAAYDYDEKRILLYMRKELEERKIICSCSHPAGADRNSRPPT